MKLYAISTKDGNILPGLKLLRNDGKYIDKDSSEIFELTNELEVLPTISAILKSTTNKRFENYVGCEITVRPSNDSKYYCYELQTKFNSNEIDIKNNNVYKLWQYFEEDIAIVIEKSNIFLDIYKLFVSHYKAGGMYFITMDNEHIKIEKRNDIYIYESPDEGNTIYRRKFGQYENKEKIK